MATRFYFRSAAASQPPSAGEQSTAMPVGTFKGNSGASFESLSLSTTAGSAQTSKVLAGLAQSTHQDLYIARFTSPPIAGQVITAQTWTRAVGAQVSNTNANNGATTPIIYVWRPSTAAVVGYIVDADVGWGGTIPGLGTTEIGVVGTVSGSAVTCADGDVLVCEYWIHANSQLMSTSYNYTLWFEGATAPSDNTGTSDAASYIETPQNLLLTFLPILSMQQPIRP